MDSPGRKSWRPTSRLPGFAVLIVAILIVAVLAAMEFARLSFDFYDGDDPAAKQVLASVMQVMLAVLNDAPEVSIMTLDAAQLALLPPNAASWNLRMYMSRQSGAAGNTPVVLSKTGEPGPAGGVQGIGERFASRLLGLAARPELNSGIRTSASRLFLDTTRPAQERVNALIRLSVFVMNRDEIDAATVLAAELSTPAMTRRVIWQTLARTAFEPALVEPLRRAMLSDPDPAGARRGRNGASAVH
jgi:hypothetical protein